MVNFCWQDWKIRLHRLPYFDDEWEIIPYLPSSSGVTIAVPKDNSWELKTIKQGETIPNDLPTLKVRGAWILALREEIERQLGKTEVQVLEGELKATQYHLEDLRDMLDLRKEKSS